MACYYASRRRDAARRRGCRAGRAITGSRTDIDLFSSPAPGLGLPLGLYHAEMTGEDAVWAYSEDLRHFASYLCRHPEDAEDVAQNTLLRAAQHIEGFRGEASVRTWLHTIATNECRMMRRRTAPDSLDELLDKALTASPRLDLDSPDVLPEEAALEAEARRAVVAALKRLPANYQRVLYLRDGCGLRSAEVADLLNTTVPAAKSTLYRARLGLRRELAQRAGI